MAEPTMLYFGPWDSAGHYLYWEGGRSECPARVGMNPRPNDFPWNEWDSVEGIDCQLQPGCKLKQDGKGFEHSAEQAGIAKIHHKNGWTAIALWDRSVDTRGGCNSTYFAKGDFSFEEMVKMAKERFSERWKKHGDVKEYL